MLERAVLFVNVLFFDLLRSMPFSLLFVMQSEMVLLWDANMWMPLELQFEAVIPCRVLLLECAICTPFPPMTVRSFSVMLMLSDESR